MSDEPVFRGVIDFFVDLGIYDVILPFLLVFSIIYAILDKTKVLGTEEINGVTTGKKNINAMVAFVIAFLVVVSKQLVATINKALANIVLLLLMVIMFLMLIGVFFKKDEEVALEKGAWRTAFMVVLLIATIFIFLNAIPTNDGESNWLTEAWNWLVDHWSSNAVGGIILVIVVIVLMIWITSDKKENKMEHS